MFHHVKCYNSTRAYRDEHLFLKVHRVITPEGEGELVDAIGDKMVVKLANRQAQTFLSDDLKDNNNAG